MERLFAQTSCPKRQISNVRRPFSHSYAGGVIETTSCTTKRRHHYSADEIGCSPFVVVVACPNEYISKSSAMHPYMSLVCDTFCFMAAPVKSTRLWSPRFASSFSSLKSCSVGAERQINMCVTSTSSYSFVKIPALVCA